MALGPRVERDLADETNWILWPDRAGDNRLLSLTTGVDWDLPRELFAVRGGSPPVLVGAPELDRRGFFAARRAAFPDRLLVPIGRPGTVSATTLALADGATRGAKEALFVSAVSTGDEIVAIRRRATGRVLLIEAPAAGERWGRFWTLGRGWPPGSPAVRGASAVPGLLRARDVPRLLGRPQEFDWTPAERLLRREADRWLEIAWSPWPTIYALAAGIVGVVAGVALLARDSPRGGADRLPYVGFVAPATVLLTPWLGRQGGPGFFPLYALLIAAVLSEIGRRSPVAVAAIGLLAAGAAPPESPWSAFLLGRTGATSGETIGALAVYAAYALAATKRREGMPWVIPRAFVAIVFLAVLSRDPESAAVILLSAAVGEGVLRRAWPVAAFGPGALSRLMREGIGLRWGGLTPRWPAPDFVDLGAWLPAFPALMGTTLAAILLPAMTTPYTDRQLRIAWATGPPGRAALGAAGIVALASLLRPELGGAIPIALASASAAFVADARAVARRGVEIGP